MTQQPPPPRPQNVQYQPQPPAGNGLAIASLVLGIVAVVVFCIPVLPWLLGLAAIVLGAVAIAQAGPGGNGKAKAGLILGVLGLALSIGFWMAARAGVSWLNKKAQENGQTIQQRLDEAAKKMEEQQKKAEEEMRRQQNQPPATQPGSMRMERFEFSPGIGFESRSCEG